MPSDELAAAVLRKCREIEAHAVKRNRLARRYPRKPPMEQESYGECYAARQMRLLVERAIMAADADRANPRT